MSLTRTTLAAACAAGDRSIKVASATGFLAGRKIVIENEQTQIESVDGTTIKLGIRGQNGTKDEAHNIKAPVVVSDGTVGDFPSVGPNQKLTGTYGAAGAIAVPEVDAQIALASGAASAMTIADPSVAQDGLKLSIMALTAHAYTLSSTNGFGAGGGSLDVCTFGGAVGDNIVIEAWGGRWHVVSTRNVTLG
jgi:hypothetical protein